MVNALKRICSAFTRSSLGLDLVCPQLLSLLIYIACSVSISHFGQSRPLLMDPLLWPIECRYRFERWIWPCFQTLQTEPEALYFAPCKARVQGCVLITKILPSRWLCTIDRFGFNDRIPTWGTELFKYNFIERFLVVQLNHCVTRMRIFIAYVLENCKFKP